MTPYPFAPARALLAAPAEGLDEEILTARLRAVCPTGEIGVRVGGHLPKARPGGADELPLLPCPHTALLLLRGPGAEALPAVMRGISGMIDPAASVAMTGMLHDVRPGDGAILVALLAARRRELSRAAFAARWLNGHAPFGLRIDASAYRQLHASQDGSHDGIGLVWFRDAAHMASARAAPEIARDATADEMEFIDHSRSMLAMFRIVESEGQ